MGLSLITPPQLEPIALEEARSHCRVTTQVEDGLLAGYILATRAYTETYLRRSLVTQSWKLTIDEGWPRHFDRVRQCHRYRITIPRPPMQAVDSIQYIDLDGTTQTLASNQYRVSKGDTDEWFVEPEWGVLWPCVRCVSAAITVNFIAGYGDNPGDIPETIRQGMLLLIGHFYNNREAVVVEGARAAAITLPYGADELLSPHRVFY